MDYKEKYEEALERAKDIYNDDPNSGTARVVCEQIFPELKESEDERIRRSLVKYFKRFYQKDMWDEGISFKDIVDWLERQKEKIEVNLNDCVEVVLTKRGAKSLNERIQCNVPADQRANYKEGDTYTDQLWAIIRYFAEDMGCGFDMPFSGIKILKVDNGLEKQKEPNIEHIQRSWYMEGYFAGKFRREPRWIIKTGDGGPRYEDNPRHGLHLTEDKKEQKPTERDEDTKINLDRALQIIKKAKGTLQGYQSDDGIYECDKAIECLEHFLYRGLEIEKAAEWSDEDEIVYESIQTILLAESRFVVERKWFDSIKARIKSAYWDEKDEKMRDRLIDRLNWITYNTRTDGTSPNITFFDEIEWLKSLRPQPKWKPNEAQMNELHGALIPGHEFDCDVLQGLYADLKKLMEE